MSERTPEAFGFSDPRSTRGRRLQRRSGAILAPDSIYSKPKPLTCTTCVPTCPVTGRCWRSKVLAIAIVVCCTAHLAAVLCTTASICAATAGRCSLSECCINDDAVQSTRATAACHPAAGGREGQAQGARPCTVRPQSRAFLHTATVCRSDRAMFDQDVGASGHLRRWAGARIIA